MRYVVRVLSATFIWAITAHLPAAAQQDAQSLDRLFLAQFPGANILRDEARAYDEQTFYTGPMQKTYEAGDTMTLEGRVREAVHRAPAGRATIEVFRAYAKAVESFGFEELYSCKSRADCNGNMAYMYVKSRSTFPFSNDQRYAVYERTKVGVREVVSLLVTRRTTGDAEFQAPFVGLDALSTDAEETQIEFLSASDIADAIETGGTVAIYGLEFATDSAELLPASTATLVEIARYLSDNPGQEVLIVGHTDNVGNLSYNQDLSQRRAQSVVKALTSDYAIAGARLNAHGVGYLAPKASNASEDGRAQNRRVEIVAR